MSQSQTQPAAREVAWRALGLVANGRNLPDALAESGLAALAPRERAFAGRLAAYSTRHKRRLESQMQSLLKRPTRDQDLLNLLVLGAAQLELDDVADHAAVHATVELAAPRMRGLVNAVLRRRLREAVPACNGWEEQYSFPDWMMDAIKRDWPGQAQAIMSALNQDPAMCLRVNRQKLSRQDWLQQLPDQFQVRALGEEPAQADGVLLTRHVSLDEVPGFAQGQVSVQGASAQAAVALMNLQPGQQVLDACCAPGGKTAHMLEQVPDLQVLAMDIDEQRLQRVRENLQRLGLQAELAVGDAGAKSFDQRFDRILLDVPCSGSGVIARHPDIKWLRRASDLGQLVAMQKTLLANAWQALKPGGKLLYCSCSIFSAENDGVIADFVQGRDDVTVEPIDLPFGQASEYGWRVAPQSWLEGFYYARLVKS